ncbi:plasmid partitioning protein RepB C-terminal domain-containing protein [Mesorhizobium sp. M1348]|uniref:plasmid partitioning protein RepB C-terminal domain-containing protein n=1 Tax=unclassified Mesorhizobium TaxID=325217 RepID=UPI003334E6A2
MSACSTESNTGNVRFLTSSLRSQEALRWPLADDREPVGYFAGLIGSANDVTQKYLAERVKVLPTDAHGTTWPWARTPPDFCPGNCGMPIRLSLKGICPEVAEMLNDRFVPTNSFIELRKLAPVRQIEAAQLMIAMNKFSINYAKSRVGATPQSQLADTSQPKKLSGLSDAQIALMENESANVDKEYRLIEESDGSDHLDLVVATACADIG